MVSLYFSRDDLNGCVLEKYKSGHLHYLMQFALPIYNHCLDVAHWYRIVINMDTVMDWICIRYAVGSS